MGLLDFLDNSDATPAQKYGLLNGGLALLAASKPMGVGANSYTPNTGATLASGFQGYVGGQQAYAQQQLAALKNQTDLAKYGLLNQAYTDMAGANPQSGAPGASYAGGTAGGVNNGTAADKLARVSILSGEHPEKLPEYQKSVYDLNNPLQAQGMRGNADTGVQPIQGYTQNMAANEGAKAATIAAAQLPFNMQQKAFETDYAVNPNGQYMANGRAVNGPTRNGTGLPVGMSAPQPGNPQATFTPLANAVYGNETNYGADKRISPAGANGPMQLMPGTQADPGYGVTPAKDSSAQENMRVGADYLGAMKQHYGNDTHALMAYNWGPGNVDKWLANGGDPKSVPQETRAYVGEAMMRQAMGQPVQDVPQRPVATPGVAVSDKAYADDTGKNTAAFEKDLNARVDTGAGLMLRNQEMSNLMDQFRTGATAEVRSKMGAYARDLGAPETMVKGLAGGDPGAAQEFQKLAAQSALEGLKQSIGANRMLKTEFDVFQKNNPNLVTDPTAIQKIFQFQSGMYQKDLAEQQGFQQFKQSGEPLENFQPYWANQRNTKMQAAQAVAPKKPAMYSNSDIQAELARRGLK